MKHYRKFPSIEGFDTESYRGNILLITSSDNYSEPKSFGEILDFLWYNGKQLNFFFNIGFDFSIILKPYLLQKDKKEWDEIRKFRTFKYGDYELSFVGNKGFHITIGKKTKDYFDISQFYNDGSFKTLDTVAKEVLGTGKNNEELEIDRARIGSEEGYYIKNREKIIKYGIQDANLTKLLAIEKIKSIQQTFDVIPKRWYSSASIAKSYLDLKHNDEKWQFWKLIDGNIDMFEYIYYSYYGGIFNTPQLGYNDNISEIDINSAYPDAIRKLYSIRNASITKVFYPGDKADYGFYRVKLKYNGLIPYRFKSSLIYPVSFNKIETFLTKLEYDYWKDKIDIQFLDGYEIITEKHKTFSDYEEIYEKRSKIKKDKSLEKQMYQWNLKTVMNASYGCMAESRNNFTYWSNFIYASYITAMTRIKIYRAIEEIGKDNVVSVMTDAIVFKDKGQKITVSDELGDFKYEDEFRKVAGIFYMNGLYIINKHLKKRGFPSLKIEDLKGKTEVSIKRLKIRKILEAIVQDKVKEIGDFQLEDKSINLKVNMYRMDYPEYDLQFDYLNLNTIKGLPIIVSEKPHLKPYDKEKLDKMIYRERKNRRWIK